MLTQVSEDYFKLLTQKQFQETYLVLMQVYDVIPRFDEHGNKITRKTFCVSDFRYVASLYLAWLLPFHRN